MSAVTAIGTDADHGTATSHGEGGNMSRTFLDQLGWIEQSPNLKSTLRRAFVYASEQSHREVTLEHTLLALTEDPDASDVLRACNVEIDNLRNAVASFIGQHNDRLSPSEIAPPSPSSELLSIMNHASAATNDSERTQMDGSVVLAAMISEANSPAANLLRVNGLSINLPEADPAVEQLGQVAEPDTPALQAPDQSDTAPANIERSDQSIDEMLAEVRSKVHKQEGVTDPIVTATPPPPARPQATSTAPGQPPKSAPPGQMSSGQMAQPASPFAVRPPLPANAKPAHPQPNQAAPYRAPTPRVQQPAPNGVQPRRGPNPNGHPPPQQHPPQIPSQAQPPRPNGMPANGAGAAEGARRVGGTNQFANPQTQPPPAQPHDARGPQPPAVTPSPSDQQSAKPEIDQVGLTETAGSILLEAIPRRLKVGQTERAHIRIRRKDIEALASAFNLEDPGKQPGAKVVQALTVRLHSPGRSIRIEPESPETQWVHSGSGLFTDDELSWRWAVTGQEAGSLKLKVEAATRTVTPEGRLFEAVLPAQSFDIRIARPWLNQGIKTLAVVIGLGAAFAIGLYGTEIGGLIATAANTVSR